MMKFEINASFYEGVQKAKNRKMNCVRIFTSGLLALVNPLPLVSRGNQNSE